MDSGTQRPRRNSHRAPSARHLRRSARISVRLLLGLCLLLAPAMASAAEIFCVGKLGTPDTEVKKAFSDHGIDQDDCVIAKVEGAISEGDAESIEDFLLTNSGVVYLELNLVGGDVHESMEIGGLVREWSLLTFATGSNTCASSCVLIWLGGAFKYAGNNHLKVHRFYVLDEEFRQMSGIEIDSFYQNVTS